MLQTLKTFLTLFFILFTTVGCMGKHLFTESTDYYLALQDSGITDEINLLENKLSEQKDISPEMYLYLALLYSQKSNPRPDYQKASIALDRYEDLTHPSENLRLEIQFLKNILKKPKRLAKKEQTNQELKMKTANELLLKEKKSLQKQCASLKQKIDSLNKENQIMKNLIDQLKMLDIELEQKKRAIR